jgi:hypothetical protein
LPLSFRRVGHARPIGGLGTVLTTMRLTARPKADSLVMRNPIDQWSHKPCMKYFVQSDLRPRLGSAKSNDSFSMKHKSRMRYERHFNNSIEPEGTVWPTGFCNGRSSYPSEFNVIRRKTFPNPSLTTYCTVNARC